MKYTIKHLYLVLLTLLSASCADNVSKDSPIPPADIPQTVGSKWIARVYEYRPAPGQFVNKSLGDPAAAQSIVGKKGMVSLGAYGGYIIFGFDHKVRNLDGVDFVIHGNAFEGSSEPGAVQVSVDVNGNGIPDDQWYELRGSSYSEAVKQYTATYYQPTNTSLAQDVRWTDNKGGSGVVAAVPFHTQCYYPLFLADNPQTIAFTGNRVPFTPQIRDGIWMLDALEKGYVDNYSSDYTQVVDNDQDTANSNKFDISTAVNSAGEPVSLDKIDFIKVYTCVQAQSGPLGEVSTEVIGAISLTKN